jgi:chromosome segregation ATPase
MSPEERDQLVEAVRAALIPFKEEIKADLLDPMETRLQAQLHNLEAGQAGLRTRLDGVETRLDGVETRLDNLEAGQAGLRTRLDGVETRLGGLETRLDNLEGGQASMKTQLDGVETRLEDIDRQIISIHDDSLGPFIHIAGRQHQELVERVERLEQAFSRLHADVQRIEGGPVRKILDTATDTQNRLTSIEQHLAERGVLAPEHVIGAGERWVTWSEYRELETRVRVLEETAASYDILPGEDE